MVCPSKTRLPESKEPSRPGGGFPSGAKPSRTSLIHRPATPNKAVSVTGTPQVLLRVEGAVVFAASLWLYAHLDASWLLFALLLLAPDVAMVGYLKGPRLGAMLYNAFHTYAAPALLAGVGVLAGQPLCIDIAAIWTAHIGFDRLLGYGLKYPTRFQETHLGAIGRAPEPGIARRDP